MALWVLTIIINDGWSLVHMFPRCDWKLWKDKVVETFHLYEYWKIRLWYGTKNPDHIKA